MGQKRNFAVNNNIYRPRTYVSHLDPIILPPVPYPFQGYPSGWSQVPSWWGTPVPDGGIRMGYPPPQQGKDGVPVADLGFPRGGCANPRGGASTYYLINFSRKLHENEEILVQRWGHASLALPP